MSPQQNTPGAVLLAPSPAAPVYDLSYYIKGAAAGGICCSITHGALCPVDVVKTRVQLDPVKYNSGLIGGMRKVVAEEGAMALTTGLGATAFGYFVQGWFKFGGVEFFKIQAVSALGEEKAWDNKVGIYLGAAAAAETIADIFLCPLEAVRIRAVSDPEFCDVAAAIISHPADTLLSKINKKGAGGDGPMMARLMNIAKEVGFVNLCTVGLLPRCVMIGTLTAGQFGIFDTVMNALGASKFHFHDPNEKH
eukprot:scaffold8250_cov105-Skeletonema_marinoi.AAC.2